MSLESFPLLTQLSDQPPQLQHFSFLPRFRPDTNLKGQPSILKLKLPLNVKMVLVKWKRHRVKENPLPIKIFISVKRMFALWVIAEVLSKRVTDPDYLRAHLRKRKFAVKLTADIWTGLEGNFAGHGRFKPVMPSGPADFSISVLDLQSGVQYNTIQYNKLYLKSASIVTNNISSSELLRTTYRSYRYGIRVPSDISK